jgi:hypothetical protein
MWGNVDIQESSALGAFIRSSRADRSGNVGVQQFAQIARRTSNATGSVFAGCDSHGAERGSLKRASDAERVAIAERLAQFFANDR